MPLYAPAKGSYSYHNLELMGQHTAGSSSCTTGAYNVVTQNARVNLISLTVTYHAGVKVQYHNCHTIIDSEVKEGELQYNVHAER